VWFVHLLIATISQESKFVLSIRVAKMLYTQTLSLLALAASALAAPAEISKRAQTVYLAGDSTMARASGAITGA
jgi:hypothetical protein